MSSMLIFKFNLIVSTDRHHEFSRKIAIYVLQKIQMISYSDNMGINRPFRRFTNLASYPNFEALFVNFFL